MSLPMQFALWFQILWVFQAACFYILLIANVMLREELYGIQAVAEVRFTPALHDIAVIMCLHRWLHRFPIMLWKCQLSY